MAWSCVVGNDPDSVDRVLWMSGFAFQFHHQTESHHCYGSGKLLIRQLLRPVARVLGRKRISPPALGWSSSKCLQPELERFGHGFVLPFRHPMHRGSEPVLE